MCDQCDSPEPSLSRRELLHGAALLSAAFLTGCATQPQNELPDPYEEQVNDEFGGVIRIDPRKIVIPPPQPAQATDYGNIVPRSAWTTAPLQLRAGLPMGAINKLTIHHSGDGKMFDPKSAADVARHLQIVREAHLQRGMIDIGYHFAVDPLGRAWQLRSLAYEGQHVRMSPGGFRNNEHNIGVVALGDFNKQTVSPGQRQRLLELVHALRGKYFLNAAAVYMHGEIVQTDCPGRELKAAILDARRHNQI